MQQLDYDNGNGVFLRGPLGDVIIKEQSRYRAVGIATGYRLDDLEVGVRVPVGSRIFSSPRRPDRLWGPPAPHPVDTGGKAAGA
jgi:hypothetical protein